MRNPHRVAVAAGVAVLAAGTLSGSVRDVVAPGGVTPATREARAREAAGVEEGTPEAARRTRAADARARERGAATAPMPSADGETTAARAEAPAAAPVPSLLLHPAPAADPRALVVMTGFDPEAPRELWLWRLANGNAAVAARAPSRATGGVRFPALMIPPAGLVLVATPAGGRPHDADASQRRFVAPLLTHARGGDR